MKKPQRLRVSDVMSSKVVYIDGMATAKQAAELMRQEKTEALIVSKRDEHDAHGIVVVQDLVRAVILADMDATEVNVFEMMTKPVLPVPASMDIRYVVRLLMRTEMRRAPVEENGELVGVVSLSSLILDELLF
ncbi:MAG: CBS domain-containing protein [Gemmatimonadetes bacterium]|nr:CBS domain-containing protein [Gemmatimonadota bacterium]NNF13182.1 CBS domain-containing protein [Gemmatimonadota bacterium]NNL30345.1 CBS domain-containing protein [Gemmatimonadota bacterium]